MNWLAAVACVLCSAQPVVWNFDRLETIGGLPVRIEGDPQLIDSAAGKAIEFDGVDDALFVDQHPLAGAETFTIEAFFRPDGGAFEQRWLHLEQSEPEARILFEIRVVGASWYLDAFARGPGYNQALAFPQKLHPVGQWYHVAQVFDGKTYRSYVNGELQGEARIDFKPQGAGRASAGARINHRSYFKGAIRSARFTPRALTPGEFLK